MLKAATIVVEYRWAEGRDDRLLDLASDLVQRQVAVIVTSSTSSAIAAKAAATTIPIVFSVSDPVQLGLVESLDTVRAKRHLSLTSRKNSLASDDGMSDAGASRALTFKGPSR